MKKKIFLFGIALFLALGLVACGDDDSSDEDPVAEEAADETDEADEVDEADETDEADEADEADEEDEADEVADRPGHATSAGGITDGDRLAEVLSADSAERAWVAGLATDIVMDGPLYIEGEAERHSGGEWSGVSARKIGFYQRDTVNGVDRIPVGALSLTVEEGIHVNSPQTFFISDGPFIANVYADVYVNIPYFRLSGVRIFGDVTFATQEYFDTAVWQAWDSEAAVIQEGDDEDYETEFVLYQSSTGFATNAPLDSADATANVSNTDPEFLVAGNIYIAGDDDPVVESAGYATSAGGITDGDRLSEVLGATSDARAWVAGLASDIEMEGPLVIEGDVLRHSAGRFSGTYARKLGLYQRDTVNGVDRVPVGAYNLTVDEGIIVNSPNTFFISDGPFLAEIHSDVYVNIPYFRLTGVEIHGDVIFANEHYRDTAIAQIWDSETAEIQEGDDDDYDTDYVLYQSSSGFGVISSEAGYLNESNADFADLVTGEIRIAE